MTTQQQQTSDTSDHEIVHSRVFRAPRELVWKAWTDPELVVKWWGPRGFTTTIETMDFRVGGAWKHTMHGPDGTNYPNKSIFKEIVPLERIVYSHGGGREDGGAPGANFVGIWTFEDEGEGATRLTGRMVFSSKEARDTVVREYGAIEGGKQTLERAAECMSDLLAEAFVISREFDAPRGLVWRMWTEREHFARWFGPKGFKVEMHKFDPGPGGMFHYCMTMPDGLEMWGRGVYREIVPPARLVWLNAFSDKDGGITSHPMSPTWPKEMLTTVTFTDRGAKTLVTVRWVPFDATEIERKTFDPVITAKSGGWAGVFDQLDAYLASGLAK
jgi:uncharacterized protein YndB with AHSA1/START domain